jgi:hypothetical protein
MSSSTDQRDLAAGDRVRVREGVTGGGARPGDLGTVHTVAPYGVRPVRVFLDGDGPEPRGFEVDELELLEAVEQ